MVLLKDQILAPWKGHMFDWIQRGPRLLVFRTHITLHTNGLNTGRKQFLSHEKVAFLTDDAVNFGSAYVVAVTEGAETAFVEPQRDAGGVVSMLANQLCQRTFFEADAALEVHNFAALLLNTQIPLDLCRIFS
jgi:hypothetical protein